MSHTNVGPVHNARITSEDGHGLNYDGNEKPARLGPFVPRSSSDSVTLQAILDSGKHTSIFLLVFTMFGTIPW